MTGDPPTPDRRPPAPSRRSTTPNRRSAVSGRRPITMGGRSAVSGRLIAMGRPLLALGRRLVAGLVRLWIVPVVVLAWELATRTMAHPFFPPPSAIAVRMHELWFTGSPSRLWLNDTALGNFPQSLGRLLAGWLLAGIAGVALGVALGRSPLLYRFLDPVIQFGRALPPPALLPMFLALFSTGTRMQVATIAFGIVWPVLFNAADGARSVEPLHLETARVFGFTRGRRLLRVILPSAAPKIFAGLRLSLSLALILMVIAEFFSTDGIGFQLRAAQRSFDLPGVWGAIALLGILGYLLNQGFLLLEKRLLTWREAEMNAGGG